VNIAPDRILLTNKRLMIVRPKLLGITFQDYSWRDIGNLRMSEQMLTATVTCTVAGGRPLKRLTAFRKSRRERSTRSHKKKRSGLEKKAGCVTWRKSERLPEE
jgi:hypothetical protein